MIRKFQVVVVERTSKKCTKTCNAPAELFFSCVNQLFIDVHGIVMTGAQLTRLEIPNARAKASNRTEGNTAHSNCACAGSLRFRAYQHSRSQILRF